tara:strand:+ start:198 stop:1298 length:1101 start_codon:yes stop_codon:yes gene_type:complete
LTKIINAKVGDDKYPIVIGLNIAQEFDAFLNLYSKESVFIVADLFFKKSNFLLVEKIKRYKCIFIDGGLESKSFDSYQKLIKLLVQNKIPKDGVIVAIGGGVIGDLVAFVANTYQRGIDLILVPTTSTAMLDSSVGGKTGINYLNQVNLIGTYHNPKAIFMDIDFIKTLKSRDYYSGICEAIKMSITSDRMMFERLNSIYENVSNRNLEILEEIISWAVRIKLKHVSDDPKEKSLRLLLNYGHTFGQAIESYYGLFQDILRHGEAVSLGLIIAAKLSVLINDNKLNPSIIEKTKEILERYNLPTKLNQLKTNNIPTVETLLNNLNNDKKRLSKGNRFILCRDVGSPSVEFVKDKDKLFESFKSIYD